MDFPFTVLPRLLLMHIVKKLTAVSFFRLYRASRANQDFFEENSSERLIYCRTMLMFIKNQECKLQLVLLSHKWNGTVQLNMRNLTKAYMKKGLHFFSFEYIKPCLKNNISCAELVEFVQNVNLCCYTLNYDTALSKLVDIVKAKIVIVEKDLDMDHDFEHLKKAEELHIMSPHNLPRICSQVARFIPTLAAFLHGYHDVQLGEFFDHLLAASRGEHANREMILFGLSRKMTLHDLYEACRVLFIYNVEQIGNTSVLVNPTVAKGRTFIVIFARFDYVHLGYKWLDSYKDFPQFYNKIIMQVEDVYRNTQLSVGEEWKEKLGF